MKNNEIKPIPTSISPPIPTSIKLNRVKNNQPKPQNTKTSEHQIIKLDQLPINLKHIKIQEVSIKVPNSRIEIFPITYRNNNRPLLIQTPRLYLPFGLSSTSSFNNSNDDNSDNSNDNSNESSNEKYHLHLSLESPNNPEIKKFSDQINQIDKFCHQEYDNYKLNPSIRQNRDRFYPPFIRTKIKQNKKNHPSSFQLFDLFNQLQPLSYIIPGSWATSIIYLKHLWVNNSNWQLGLTWCVLQTKVKTPIPLFPSDRCLIDDPWEDETFCSICYAKVVKKPCVQGVPEDDIPENHEPLPEEYQKYAKMHKLGIPMLAIIQRCQMDGLDPELLRNRHQKRLTTEIKQLPTQSSLPPPPPLPPPPKPSIPTGGPRLLFNKADLLKGKSKLGTKDIKVKKVKTLRLRKRDPRVPSLDMILNSRGGLRQIRKPSDFTSQVK